MTGGASPARRGIAFERDTRRALEHVGFVVVRAAGSHGAADLVALRRGEPPRLVSCKLSGVMARRELAALLVLADRAGALPVVAFKPRAGKVGLTRLSPHGHRETATLSIPKRESHAREPERVDDTGTQ